MEFIDDKMKMALKRFFKYLFFSAFPLTLIMICIHLQANVKEFFEVPEKWIPLIIIVIGAITAAAEKWLKEYGKENGNGNKITL